MCERLLIFNKCSICGETVEEVPDGILKQNPHYHNSEFVVTHSGHKQYIHTSCWNEMIKNQKNNLNEAVL